MIKATNPVFKIGEIQQTRHLATLVGFTGDTILIRDTSGLYIPFDCEGNLVGSNLHSDHKVFLEMPEDLEKLKHGAEVWYVIQHVTWKKLSGISDLDLNQ